MEQLFECGSLAEPPEACATGDFFYEIEIMSYRVRERVRGLLSVFFAYI